MEKKPFTPLDVSVETIDKLIRNKELNAVSLYMAYVCIAKWQETNSVKASIRFMEKRLGWSRSKISRNKKVLRDFGMIEDVTRKDKKNKIIGWYVKINYIVTVKPEIPPSQKASGWEKPVGGEMGQSPIYRNTSALDGKISTLPENGRGGENFSSQDFIKKLRDDGKDYLRLIGWYFDYRKAKIPSEEAGKKDVARWVRDAKYLVDFSKSDLKRTIAFVSTKFESKWNMATVSKYISEINNK